jgi:hypothetical protein
MISTEITLIDVAALIGAFLQLSLLTVVAFRMGYRGAWLIAPWVLTVVMLIIPMTGLYVSAAKSGMDIPLGWFLVRQLPASATLPAFATLVYLAARGLRRDSSPAQVAATESL